MLPDANASGTAPEEAGSEEWAWAVSAAEGTPDTGWTLGADGTLKHDPEGLCLTAQAAGTGAMAPLALQACAGSGPSRAESASRSLRRALLMPLVNPGSLYRSGKRT